MKMDKTEPLLISVVEAANRVGLSKSTVYELIDAGRFPHKRVGRRILVPVKALERWAAEDVLDSMPSIEARR